MDMMWKLLEPELAISVWGPTPVFKLMEGFIAQKFLSDRQRGWVLKMTKTRQIFEEVDQLLSKDTWGNLYMNQHLNQTNFIFSNSSIASYSGLDQIILNNTVSLDTPNICPKSLEPIMLEMVKDGLSKLTMNDIINTHDQLEEVNQQTSWSTSMTVWLMFSILFIFNIALLSCIFHYLYTIQKSLALHLKLNTCKHRDLKYRERMFRNLLTQLLPLFQLMKLFYSTVYSVCFDGQFLKDNAS